MIHLTKEQFYEIVNHTKQEYPKEACGILAGKITLNSDKHQLKTVTKVYKMTNVSESPETCYFMKPEEQLKVFKEMRDLNIEMLGIYHSHTMSIAYPSQRDCEMAFYPEASYIIISLKDFNNPKIRAFKIIEEKIIEEEIIIID
jgi:proteasome lid subunit RPN8/RPN11